MSYSQFQHQKFQNDPEFESILDLDNVELFNRDTLYYPNQKSLLNFLNKQRLQNQNVRKKLTQILLGLIILFSSILLIFSIIGFIRYYQNVQNDSIKLLDEQIWANKMQSLEQCQSIEPAERIDCNPDPPISKEICEQRGCCWNPIDRIYSEFLSLDTKKSETSLPPINIPFCYFNPIDYNGYKIVENQSENGYYFIHLKRMRPSGFPNDIPHVQLEIYELTDEILRIKFTDLHNPRFEVPIPKLNIPTQMVDDSTKLYSIELKDSNLIIKRRSNGQSIFNVNLQLLIYSDQFIQLTTGLPSEFIYGIGEHREPFRKSTNWKRYTLFNRDQYPISDSSLYGSHPFYLSVEELNDKQPASGVFLFNSNAMDIITQPSPAITFRTIGGILDFFLFLGPKPEQVVQQYHRLIGLPTIPPYWSLGFHLSRFGYRNLTNLMATFNRNLEVEIPIDVQWTDIDMMTSANDFTYDEKHFKGLPDFIDNVLHKNGMKFVPMFDPGISASESPTGSYPPYDYGVELDIFIKNSSKQIFIGKVWNRQSTVWPDFFHPNATKYWTKMFSDYHRQISFDGAWIDMNEPSNFVDGQLRFGCPRNNNFELPPYTPGMTDDSLTLRHKTLCMTARHYNDQLHYNLHNLYGLQETIITNKALKTTLNKRPFIISRSTAPGHGHFGHHWTGDIVSDWSSMRWSISSILNFNLFGIPMVGADICGFNGNTTEELCARWHQLGAFYTFARNHNTDDAIDQDPAALGPYVIQAAKYALLVRYAHLPYLYTLFYNVHQNGGTVLRPLFFEFPGDQNSYKIDTQFMWGSSMMIAPALLPNQKKIDVYFPKGTWYFISDYQRIEGRGEFISMPALPTYPSVYYRSGSIIPIQKPNITTESTRQEPFSLLIVLENEQSDAIGSLFMDSGDDIDSVELGHYNLYDFKVKDQKLSIESKHLGYQTKLIIDEIILVGFYRKPKSISIDDNKKIDPSNFKYDKIRHTLTINNLQLSLYTKQNLMKKISNQIYWNLLS
uniref:Lysosomal alpha-glucosidase-like n=1 Tax=Dermatophagoides pteronyssinus TaxID=6956 RepID=A0A6P6YFU9_DERPT|nr:lysosomal alpha-glucosidase-like [Dermatophagoides pteronyssinus]